MESIKHWLDSVSTIIGLSVISAITWFDNELPEFTKWLSFISVLCSVIWWGYRYHSALKKRKEVKKYE